MKKRALSLLLVFVMLLSACPIALAAEESETRETSFFTDQEHADVNFADMKYEHIDAEPILEEIEAVRALLEDAANEEEVQKRFTDLTDQFMKIATMYRLINIQTYQDATNEEAAEELSYAAELWDVLADALCLLEKDILNSKCSGFLDEVLSEEEKESYLEYEAMTDEEFALSSQETALENEYWAAAMQTVTVEYEGEEWDDASIYDAYVNGLVDDDTYTLVSRALAKAKNALLGDIYMRMLEVRQQTAKLAGYDNYAEYAYSEIYDRDYSIDEIRAFHAAVKEYIMPLYNDFYELYLNDYYSGAFDALYGDYGGDGALDIMEPYIARMSSELLEAFTYMREHGLYDSDYSPVKSDSGFTTMLYAYGAPFFFNAATDYGDPYDFTTAVHEFGHYNNYYWQPTGWEEGSKNIDLAEVHSQGLELMFSHWYPEIFGEEDSQTLLNYQIFNMLYAIYTGAFYDELQLYVYTNEDMTLQKINEEYCRLCKEYGVISADDPRTEMYSWVDIHHSFNSPCYYISYAVSAAGALDFWLEAQEGSYFDALDHYLAFTALDAEPSFQESFELVGMESPISPEYVSDLAQALREAMGVDQRLAMLPPDDLTGYEWFAEEVYTLFVSGLIEKDENNCIRPYDAALWSEAALLVTALTEKETAQPENAGAPITRGEFAQMLADALELTGEDAASPFSDTDSAAVAALTELGVFAGQGDGTFLPDLPITRAEMYVAACRLVMSVLDQLLQGAAA